MSELAVSEKQVQVVHSNAGANGAKRKVLDYLKEHWNVYLAAKHAGIRRATIYNEWLEKDTAFAQAYQEILDSHLDGAENNLMGQAVHNEKAYVPAIFMLKSHRRAIYGDKLLPEGLEVTAFRQLSDGVLEAIRLRTAPVGTDRLTEAKEVGQVKFEELGDTAQNE